MKNIHLNLDRKTGYIKGYAFIEYANLLEAQKAVNSLNATKFLDKKLNVNFAFKKANKNEIKVKK